MQPLTIAAYPQLKPFFAGQPHLLSVYSLPSLIAWNNEIYKPVYTIRDQVLLVGSVCTPRPEENHLILPIAPAWDAPPQELCLIAREFGFFQILFCSPGVRHALRPPGIVSLF